MSLKNQLAVGLDKGFVTAKRTSKKTRPSRRRGKQNAAVGTVRQIVREVVGLTPYVIFFVSRSPESHYTHTHTCINTGWRRDWLIFTRLVSETRTSVCTRSPRKEYVFESPLLFFRLFRRY